MDFTEYQSSQDNTTAMGDLFERLVQLYLLTSPEFESKIENVWWPKFQKLPEGLKEDLNLTFPDEGIDLVAKTRDGNYWPIQAKYESDTAGAKTKKKPYFVQHRCFCSWRKHELWYRRTYQGKANKKTSTS